MEEGQGGAIIKNFYILALVPFSALLYFGVLYIIGGIDREDRLLLTQVITGRLAKPKDAGGMEVRLRSLMPEFGVL